MRQPDRLTTYCNYKPNECYISMLNKSTSIFSVSSLKYDFVSWIVMQLFSSESLLTHQDNISIKQQKVKFAWAQEVHTAGVHFDFSSDSPLNWLPIQRWVTTKH